MKFLLFLLCLTACDSESTTKRLPFKIGDCIVHYKLVQTKPEEQKMGVVVDVGSRTLFTKLLYTKYEVYSIMESEKAMEYRIVSCPDGTFRWHK